MNEPCEHGWMLQPDAKCPACRIEAAERLRAPVWWLSNPPGPARWWFNEAASFGRWRPSYRSMWVRSARQIPPP